MVNPFTPVVTDPRDSIVKPVEGPATTPAVPNLFAQVNPSRIASLAVQDAQAADALQAETPTYIAEKTRRAQETDKRNQERLGVVQGETNLFTQNLTQINAEQQKVDALKLDVARRSQKVADMNPILRPFIQLFHPSLSDEEIQQDAMAAEMQGRALSDQFVHANQSYSSMLQAHSTLWGAEDNADKSAGAVTDTVFNGLITTVEMADRSLKTTAGAYNAIANAKADEYQMASVALAGLTDAQVSAAEQAARAKGSATADINGVQVPLGMIEHTRQLDQQAAVSREAGVVALQNGKIALANQLVDRHIKEMSLPALMAAVKAGGNGLPMTQLQTELAQRSMTGAAAGQVIDSAEQGVARVAGNLSQIGNVASQVVRRYGFTNGNGQITNVRTQQAVQNFLQTQARTLDDLAAARKSGMTPALEEKITGKLNTAFEAMMTQMSADFAGQGGSKEMIAARRSFLVNGQLDPATASTILTDGIMSGQTADQLKLRGPAANAYNAGYAKMLELTAPAAGLNAATMKVKTKEQQLAMFQQALGSGKLKKDEVLRQIVDATRGAYSAQAAQNLHLNIPQLLKDSGVDTGVTNQAWQEALHAGEAMIVSQIKQRYGLSDAHAQDVVNRGENSPFYNDGLRKAGVTSASLAGAGASATMQYLDANYSNGSFIPSASIAAGLSSPQFGMLSGNLQPAMANKDFGNFVINSFVGDNIASHTDGMRSAYIKAANNRMSEIKGSWNRGVGLYQNDPKLRFDAVLHNVGDLTPADVKALSEEVRKHLPQAATGGMSQLAGLGGLKPDYSGAFDAMGLMKFDNPRLESLRKKTVAALPKAIETTDRVMAIRGSANPVILGETE